METQQLNEKQAWEFCVGQWSHSFPNDKGNHIVEYGPNNDGICCLIESMLESGMIDIPTLVAMKKKIDAEKHNMGMAGIDYLYELDSVGAELRAGLCRRFAAEIQEPEVANGVQMQVF